MNNYFDKKYIKYWRERVNNPSDGTKVATTDSAKFFIKKLGISEDDIILDLGCGFGRLYPVLSSFTPKIFGIDINKETINEASKYPYQKLTVGTAEQTKMISSLFDKIIAWEVYDVVEQDKALIEENRILKKGGLFLVTGKNKKYKISDKLAFIAERNAKLKGFPNHFTDIYELIKKSKLFGFRVIAAHGFAKRGDFGNLDYFNILSSRNEKSFYQFLLILKKISEPKIENYDICCEYSDTAKALAKKNNFSDLKLFFKWHKDKYGE